MLRLQLQTPHSHLHPDDVLLHHRPATVPKKTGHTENTLLSETLATSSPQFPPGLGLCPRTPTARCASFQRTPGRGSAISGLGLTTSGRRQRASVPSWSLIAVVSLELELLPPLHRTVARIVALSASHMITLILLSWRVTDRDQPEWSQVL